jgi:hypothetical protein
MSSSLPLPPSTDDVLYEDIIQKGVFEGLCYCNLKKHWVHPLDIFSLKLMICKTCKNEKNSICACGTKHNNLKKNGLPAKMCSKCRLIRDKSAMKRQKVDENGLIGCLVCSKRFPIENFPFNINNPLQRIHHCNNCSIELMEKNKALFKPFKTQVESFREKHPYCAITGILIEDGDDHFDHIPEKGEKLHNVTYYPYWASSKRGKTLEDRLKLHLKELEKCQRITVAAHFKITKERRGKLSTSEVAKKYQKRRKLANNENWDFIQNSQNGLCGCGCGTVLTKEMVIDFDHDLSKGEKLFNMGQACLHSKKSRDEERLKGSFMIHHHHRATTIKRFNEAHEQRNNNKKIKHDNKSNI